MPGYDKSKFVELTRLEIEEFTCSICLEIFREPLVTPCCRQTYCGDCIAEWLAGNSKCPNDNKQLLAGDLVAAPRIIVNVIEKLPIVCDYQMYGCRESTSLSSLAQHLLTCQYRPRDKVCKLCSNNYADISSHDCTESLLLINVSLRRENNELKRENEKLMAIIKQMKENFDEELDAMDGRRVSLTSSINETPEKFYGDNGVDFCGKFQLRFSDNMDEYMEVLGVSYLTRMLINSQRPVIEIVKDSENEMRFTISTNTAFRTTQIKFKIGEEFKDWRVDGKRVKTIINAIGNKMIQTQFDEKEVIIIREFYRNCFKSIDTVFYEVNGYKKNTTAIRVYQRIE